MLGTTLGAEDDDLEKLDYVLLEQVTFGLLTFDSQYIGLFDWVV